MNIDNQTVPLRKKEEQNRKKIIAERIYQQQLRLEEMVNTITTDATLSQSYGNPKWYPPVPQYTPPEGRRVTSQEVRDRNFRIAQENTEKEKSEKTKTEYTDIAENFGDAWVLTSLTPITIEEYDALDSTTSGYVDPYRSYTHDSRIRTIQGLTVTERFSYPNIVDRVKWFATFFCTEQGDEILGIYCYENSKAIEELTEFLIDTSVINEEDKNDAIITLSKLHSKLIRLTK